MATEQVFSPESIEAALDLADRYGSDLLVIAGGTLAMSLINEGILSPRYAMTLHRAPLHGVRAAMNHFEIGAATTLMRLAGLAEVPLLADAAQHVGGWAIRNMATLAGNLFVPPPAGDAAVALLALDAEVVVARKGGTRQVPIDKFFTGWMQTALRPGELVTRIDVPRPRGRTAFLKCTRREMNAPAVVTVAAQVTRNEAGLVTDARIALGAAGDFPLRARPAEAALKARPLDAPAIADAAAAALQAAQPFGDAIASEWYRRKMIGVYVRRALESIRS